MKLWSLKKQQINKQLLLGMKLPALHKDIIIIRHYISKTGVLLTPLQTETVGDRETETVTC